MVGLQTMGSMEDDAVSLSLPLSPSLSLSSSIGAVAADHHKSRVFLARSQCSGHAEEDRRERGRKRKLVKSFPWIRCSGGAGPQLSVVHCFIVYLEVSVQQKHYHVRRGQYKG